MTTDSSILSPPGDGPDTAAPAVQRGHERSTRLVFFVCGLVMSSWAPLVPFAKANADVGNALLGVVLLCLGAGSLLAMPIAGRLVARHGCRPVIVSSSMLACVALVALPHAASPLQLSLVLLGFGAGLGTLDVSMNLQAIAVERAAARTMMSGFHALFSLGGIAGALAMAALLAIDTTPSAATVAIAVVGAIAAVATAPWLVADRAAKPGPMFGIPHGVVLLIGGLCFVSFLMEGAVLDWSAVLLSSVRDLPVSRAGIGYAAFSAAMVIGRLTGDRVVARFGPRRTLMTGACAAAAGALVVALVPDWRLAVAGFFVVGLGCANIVPILFTAAGRQTTMPETLAVPAVTTIGYAGLLAGPAGIGLLAGHVGLAGAFVALALAMAVCAVLGRALPR